MGFFAEIFPSNPQVDATLSSVIKVISEIAVAKSMECKSDTALDQFLEKISGGLLQMDSSKRTGEDAKAYGMVELSCFVGAMSSPETKKLLTERIMEELQKSDHRFIGREEDIVHNSRSQHIGPDGKLMMSSDTESRQAGLRKTIEVFVSNNFSSDLLGKCLDGITQENARLINFGKDGQLTGFDFRNTFSITQGNTVKGLLRCVVLSDQALRNLVDISNTARNATKSTVPTLGLDTTKTKDVVGASINAIVENTPGIVKKIDYSTIDNVKNLVNTNPSQQQALNPIKSSNSNSSITPAARIGIVIGYIIGALLLVCIIVVPLFTVKGSDGKTVVERSKK